MIDLCYVLCIGSGFLLLPYEVSQLQALAGIENVIKTFINYRVHGVGDFGHITFPSLFSKR